MRSPNNSQPPEPLRGPNDITPVVKGFNARCSGCPLFTATFTLPRFIDVLTLPRTYAQQVHQKATAAYEVFASAIPIKKQKQPSPSLQSVAADFGRLVQYAKDNRRDGEIEELLKSSQITLERAKQVQNELDQNIEHTSLVSILSSVISYINELISFIIGFFTTNTNKKSLYDSANKTFKIIFTSGNR